MEIVSEPDMRSVFKPRLDTRISYNGCSVYMSRSPEEAGEYVRTLQAMLRAVGASDGSMELVSPSPPRPPPSDDVSQGSLRCDVNVSVNKPGQPPGTRCEIKNLNSVKFMMVAISTSLLVPKYRSLHGPLASEVFRHIDLLARGQTILQETRGFDEAKAETFKLRSKEDSPDYRYMPDPNLPPLLLPPVRISFRPRSSCV